MAAGEDKKDKKADREALNREDMEDLKNYSVVETLRKRLKSNIMTCSQVGGEQITGGFMMGYLSAFPTSPAASKKIIQTAADENKKITTFKLFVQKQKEEEQRKFAKVQEKVQKKKIELTDEDKLRLQAEAMTITPWDRMRFGPRWFVEKYIPYPSGGYFKALKEVSALRMLNGARQVMGVCMGIAAALKLAVDRAFPSKAGESGVIAIVLKSVLVAPFMGLAILIAPAAKLDQHTAVTKPVRGAAESVRKSVSFLKENTVDSVRHSMSSRRSVSLNKQETPAPDSAPTHSTTQPGSTSQLLAATGDGKPPHYGEDNSPNERVRAEAVSQLGKEEVDEASKLHMPNSHQEQNKEEHQEVIEGHQAEAPAKSDGQLPDNTRSSTMINQR